MGEIKINNEIYGTSNSSNIVYKDTTVEEKLDTIPVFDINDNGNVDNDGSDVLTYGHIIDNLESDAENKVLSAKQGKILNEKFDNIDLSYLEDGINNISEELNNFRNTFLNLVYPIGAVYLSLNNTDPGTLFGGTWEAIAEGKALWSAGKTINSDVEIAAGLPNLTGEIHANATYSGTPYSGGSFSGVFKNISMSGTQYYLNGRASGSGWYDIGFDASQSNSIYGKSTTVQPPAYTVYMWKRVS